MLNSGLHLYSFLMQFVCYPSGSMYIFPYPQCNFIESMFPVKIAINIRKIYVLGSCGIKMLSGTCGDDDWHYLFARSSTTPW